MSKAHEILEAAQGHMKDRAATYDKPQGERSMCATVEAFNAITGAGITEEQGWLFMILLKAVRSQQGAYRADSYEDGAAYFALMGEAAAKFEGQFEVARELCRQMAEPAASMQDDSERMAAIGQNGNDGAVYLNYSCNSCGVAPGDKHKDDCQFYDQDGGAVIRNNQTNTADHYDVVPVMTHEHCAPRFGWIVPSCYSPKN